MGEKGSDHAEDGADGRRVHIVIGGALRRTF